MDMRLYRMELYKLLYKKIFRFGLLAVLGILLAYFLLVSVGGERTTINGELYTGFAAVREDRRITEKFRGVLTDEKARQIIEQYGFPSKVEENYGGFRDENYLNGFVTEQLGNGYYFSWDDYQISTALQPLAESGLGAAARAAGREVLLDYAEGWGVFLDLLQLGMILGSALIVTVVSPVFSEEHQTKMSTLLLASRNGREGAAFAKEAAAFTAAALIYAATAAAAFSMTGLVYGFRGGSCMSGMVLTPHGLNTALAFTLKPVAWAAFLMLAVDFLALMTLCAMTLCVSAHQKTAFHTAVLTLAAWAAPLLLRILFGGAGYFLACGTPMFLVMTGVLTEWYSVLFLPAGIAVCILAASTLSGWNTWRKSEADV